MEQNINNEEKKLLESYRNSLDQSILVQLYEPYMPMVYGTCLKYMKNAADAEDAMMMIYELIVEKLKSHIVDHFKPWLYVVTKNYCFDQLRKGKRRIDQKKSAQIMYSEQVFHPDTIDNEQEKLLHDCIEKLKLNQKQIIKAFYFDKMSYHKISENYKLNWSTVRSQIQNGRRMLKICIEENATQ